MEEFILLWEKLSESEKMEVIELMEKMKDRA